MHHILIIGAGRSSASLIRYLSTQSVKITVADFSLALAQDKISGLENADAVQLDIHNQTMRDILIAKADIVISLMPPDFHLLVAGSCLLLGKNLITASYVSNDIKSLEDDLKKKNIGILMECGLDPGIDHMSAMKEIDEIKNKGGSIISFKSYTGGLVAPESDDNPWHYKVSWNPRNVVLAGLGTVKYLEQGIYKYIPYHQLFSRIEEVKIGDISFEAYANRDSLKYIDIYGLQVVQTFLRGTLRYSGYCSAWDVLVQLGMTDDSFQMKGKMKLKDFTGSFLPSSKVNSMEEILCDYLHINKQSEEFQKIKWLGLFDNIEITVEGLSPAQVLQKLIEDKWRLSPADKDMIVMKHELIYELQGKTLQRDASLVVKGENSIHTAMAKTVGLPMGIAAMLILEGKLNLRGVEVPVEQKFYNSILSVLEKLGISFKVEDFKLGS